MATEKDHFERIAADFEIAYDVELTIAAKKKLIDWFIDYGGNELEKAVSIAIGQYDDVIESFEKIGGILYNRSIKKQLLFKEKEEGNDG